MLQLKLIINAIYIYESWSNVCEKGEASKYLVLTTKRNNNILKTNQYESVVNFARHTEQPKVD